MRSPVACGGVAPIPCSPGAAVAVRGRRGVRRGATWQGHAVLPGTPWNSLDAPLSTLGRQRNGPGPKHGIRGRFSRPAGLVGRFRVTASQ